MAAFHATAAQAASDAKANPAAFSTGAARKEAEEVLLVAAPFTNDIFKAAGLTSRDFAALPNLPVHDEERTAAEPGADPQHISDLCSLDWLESKLVYLRSAERLLMLDIITAAAADPQKGLRWVAEAAASLLMDLLREPLEVPYSKADEAGMQLEELVLTIVVLAAFAMQIVRLLEGLTETMPAQAAQQLLAAHLITVLDAPY